jgi:hypothetical protein
MNGSGYMDGAAPQAAEGVTGAADDYALGALRYGWGDAYRIGWDARRGWWANRRDGKREDITAADHTELWAAIFADYTSSPVRRDDSAPQAGAESVR